MRKYKVIPAATENNSFIFSGVVSHHTLPSYPQTGYCNIVNGKEVATFRFTKHCDPRENLTGKRVQVVSSLRTDKHKDNFFVVRGISYE